jgi:hypothetical protein
MRVPRVPSNPGAAVPEHGVPLRMASSSNASRRLSRAVGLANGCPRGAAAAIHVARSAGRAGQQASCWHFAQDPTACAGSACAIARAARQSKCHPSEPAATPATPIRIGRAIARTGCPPLRIGSGIQWRIGRATVALGVAWGGTLGAAVDVACSAPADGAVSNAQWRGWRGKSCPKKARLAYRCHGFHMVCGASAADSATVTLIMPRYAGSVSCRGFRGHLRWGHSALPHPAHIAPLRAFHVKHTDTGSFYD